MENNIGRSPLQHIRNFFVAILIASVLSALIWYRFYIPPEITASWDAPGFPIGITNLFPFASSIICTVLAVFFLFYSGNKKRLISQILFAAGAIVTIVACIIFWPDFKQIPIFNTILFVGCCFMPYRRILVLLFSLVITVWAMAATHGMFLLTCLPAVLFPVALFFSAKTEYQSIFWSSSYFKYSRAG
ncbi:hypothetical protein [Christensenella tenuis]|uniref:DUF998 domain-containing protein n=1 Tax=Christensenella tenuis TaxID=2763033 RepID=A0ABR7EDU7_9FIRM|nr:hypothetical protein [Christensenella tenuis]MBC5647950.1 hypothetical protein [Christensenella tenuis]